MVCLPKSGLNLKWSHAQEGGNQMKDDELPFDHKSHVLYSKPCKKEILAKIALHYPEAEREAVWEQVQLRYAELLSDWRTDLGGNHDAFYGKLRR